MCIVKDLLTREEQRYIKRILEILPEDAPVAYEVWAIGYYNKVATGLASLLRMFDSPEEAIEYTKTMDMRQIVSETDLSANTVTTEINRISVEVETVIANDDDTMNICTIYKKVFAIK